MDALALTLFLSKATVVLLAGAAVTASLRRAPAGLRHLVWVATLASVLLLPVLLRVAPTPIQILPGGLLAPAPAPARVERGPAAAPAVTGSVVDAVAAPVAARTAEPRPSPRATSWARLPRPTLPQALLGLWALGAAGLLAWLGLSMVTARRIVRRARPLDGPRWQAALCEVADRMDLTELPRLVASDRVEIPFAHGTLRSTVVLPASAEQWDDERLRLVLVHELAHVKRRDLIGHTLARLACALYWFHPMVWIASRRLRAESERACDDLVLECGARASDYAGHLLDIVAAARRRGAPATALPMARRREFEGRVLAILDPAVRRVAPGRLQTFSILAGLAVLYVAVAATAPARRALADELQPQALAAERPPAVNEPSTTNRANARPRRVTRTGAYVESVRDGVTGALETEELRGIEQEFDFDGDDDEAGPPPSAERRALLLKLLRTDSDAGVRRSAAWALARRPQPDAAEALSATLRQDADREVREMAAWALAEVRGDAAAAALAEALRKDESAEVRSTAGWALGQRRHADSAALLAALGDASAQVRQVALWGLGNQGLESAPPALLNALGDSSEEVRLTAAWALSEIRDPASVPALRKAFDTEKSGEVRRALFRALAFMGERSSEFIDQALASKDPEIRTRAVQVAAGHGPGIWPWPWPWPQPRPFP
jgi:beta-lactamase regulating signal transducer with metallopeptidase domain